MRHGLWAAALLFLTSGCASGYVLAYNDSVVSSGFFASDPGEHLSVYGCSPRESKRSCGKKMEAKMGKAKFAEHVKKLREDPYYMLFKKDYEEVVAEWDRERAKR